MSRWVIGANGWFKSGRVKTLQGFNFPASSHARLDQVAGERLERAGRRGSFIAKKGALARNQAPATVSPNEPHNTSASFGGK